MAPEDYVSPATAFLLKEKGFDEPTEGFYWGKDCRFETGTLQHYNQVVSIGSFSGEFKKVTAAAPTLYEAQKWLRNTYNIHLCVKCTAYVKRYNGNDYMCEILDLLHHQHKGTPIYHSYEQTLNEGIREALKLI